MAHTDETLNFYLKEINKIPLLSHEEEVELAKKAALGNRYAKEKLVNANLRFVIKIAKTYQNKGLELEDLISEGNIGLLKAVEKFDVSRGYHFISYAVWWIRQSILNAISEKGRAIRLPLNRANDLVQIEHAKKEVGKDLSESEELKQVANLLGMQESYVRELMDIAHNSTSLDSEIVGKGKSTFTLGELLEDTISAKPEDTVIEKELKNDLKNTMQTLKPNEAQVLRMRYGLDGKKPMSLQEVGAEFNLTKERIRQIEKTAITRMQHPVRRCRLEAYVA